MIHTVTFFNTLSKGKRFMCSSYDNCDFTSIRNVIGQADRCALHTRILPHPDARWQPQEFRAGRSPAVNLPMV